jgi:chemotaxis response regulator CheB
MTETETCSAFIAGPESISFVPQLMCCCDRQRKFINRKLMGVFLSGGGVDGIEGARYISDSGGSIILQNRESSLLWDLPGKIYIREKVSGQYSDTKLVKEIL